VDGRTVFVCVSQSSVFVRRKGGIGARGGAGEVWLVVVPGGRRKEEQSFRSSLVARGEDFNVESSF